MGFSLPEVDGLAPVAVTDENFSTASGRFSLPPEFDKKKYVGKWALDGPEVEAALQPEYLSFARAKADGWTVWKRDIPYTQTQIVEAEEKDKPLPKKKNLPYVQQIGRHKYVLMFRPRALQKAIHQVYAAQSRSLLNGELLGDTKSVAASDDGVFGGRDLGRFYRDQEEEEAVVGLPVVLPGRPQDATTEEIH